MSDFLSFCVGVDLTWNFSHFLTFCRGVTWKVGNLESWQISDFSEFPPPVQEVEKSEFQFSYFLHVGDLETWKLRHFQISRFQGYLSSPYVSKFKNLERLADWSLQIFLIFQIENLKNLVSSKSKKFETQKAGNPDS